MIVKIMSNGKSFKACAAYLTHDADRANTSDRVDWSHTHNCANDHVEAAVSEMVWTARDAELLKQEAGIRAGGRATENSVKHVSLNWAPDETPTREHMTETSEDFLRHMKWQDHQAIFVAHNDKSHSHVHLMINMIHPETGLKLNEDFERRRAQEWALQYEREHGIYCEQRLENVADRARNPPRNVWMEFWVNQKEFEKSEKSLRENTRIIQDERINVKNQEWKILKEFQKTERTEFFAEGKSEFKALRNSIYHEVREEFRGRWGDYFTAKREGTDPETLAALKESLVADQKALLEARRDDACTELRASRDEGYRALLDNQQEMRAHLRWCQDAGLDNMPLLQSLQARDVTQDISAAFREAAEATTRPAGDESRAATLAATREESGAGGGDATILDLGLGVCTAFDSLLSIFEGVKPASSPSRVDTGSFEAAAQEALKRDREREDAEEREKHRAFYGE